jgi:hypothetical protein
MPWVEREQGQIIRMFGSIQAGRAEEKLASDHPDVVAFHAARTARFTPEARMRGAILDDPFRKALVKLLASDRGITNKEMVDLLVDQLQP